MSDFQRIFDRAVLRARDRQRIRGLIGRLNSDGTITVVVSGRPQWAHVRLGANGSEGNTIAKNAGVGLRAHLPVLLERRDGVLTIVDVDHNLAGDYYFGGLQSSVVTKHTHAINSGNEYEVEALRLQPGRVKFSSGFTVSINPFYYWYNGVWTRYAGGTIDLTSYQPSTSGNWVWVVVGVDIATNTAIANAGVEVGSQAALMDSTITNINVDDMIPCAAIQISQADTELNKLSRYRDVHGWFNQPQQQLFSKIVMLDDTVVGNGDEVVWLP